MAKVFLIVDIFVAEGDGKNALGEKVALLMNGEARVAWIVNDLIDTFGELEFLIDFLEKDRPGIGGQLGAVEEDVDFFVLGRSGCQSGRFHDTLCLVVCWEKCVAFLTQRVCKQHITTNGLFKNHPHNELFSLVVCQC